MVGSSLLKKMGALQLPQPKLLLREKTIVMGQKCHPTRCFAVIHLIQ
jgi:hypothetical protein